RVLRSSDSLGDLGIRIAKALVAGRKHGYYLSGPIRIKNRKSAEAYMASRKNLDIFDKKVQDALGEKEMMFFARIQMSRSP
ncbi:MAG: hypothetical protein ACE5PO_03765, partial [Candidatus Bathyarchaeia archaeon]